MLRTIIVPLDGSPLAERALPYAVRMAQAAQGKLVLLRAESERELEGTKAYLCGVARSIADQAPAIELATPAGHAADMIIEAAEKFAADAVVMATHGRTGFAHLLYGSVTEAVLARSGVPVLAVYARPAEAEPAVFSFASARILVAQDGSEYDAHAVHAALDLLGPQGELVLVTVAPPPQRVQRDDYGRVLAYLDQQEEALTREARDYLDEAARGLRIGHVRTDARIGDPASGIAMAAIDNKVDLIVMATHGRTGLPRAVLGSVAGNVLRAATLPVLLVHPNVSAASEPPATADVGPVPTF